MTRRRIAELWNGLACDCRFQFLSAHLPSPGSADSTFLSHSTNEVHHEVTVDGHGLAGAEAVQNAVWIVVARPESPTDHLLEQSCQGLSAGERGAILLAKSLRANLVLVDEWKARRIAREAGLAIILWAVWDC